MIFRTPKCPNCSKSLHDFIMDTHGVKLICVNCHGQIDPTIIITNSTVDFFAKIIPEKDREAFLEKLGFKKKPIVRTSKLVLSFLIMSILIGTIVYAIILYDNILKMLLTLVGGVCLIAVIIGYFKEEEIPKWRKNKTA